MAPFVAEGLDLLGHRPHSGRWARARTVAELLSGVDLSRLPGPARRAYVLSAHTLANYFRFHDHLLRERPEIRAATRLLTQRAASAASQSLGEDDPASLVLASYAAYCEAWDLGRGNPAASLRVAASADLNKQLRRLAQLGGPVVSIRGRRPTCWRSGRWRWSGYGS